MQRWTMARPRLAALSVIAALVAPTAVSASTDDMTAAGPKAPARSAETVYAGYWSGMMSRSRETAADCAEPAGSACLMVEWRAFMGDQAGRPALDQLAAVNDYVNRVRYRDDRVNWGLRDYWAAPREFFARGGDCEDFAIAKYLGLKTLGFPVEDLKVLILWDSRRGLAHAVLAVDHEGRRLVLDNVDGRIVELASLPHYQVHYSLNDKTVLRHLAARN